MNIRTFGTGAGIPRGWSLEGAREAQNDADNALLGATDVRAFTSPPPLSVDPFGDLLASTVQDADAEVNLLIDQAGYDLLSDGAWPVQNQEARNTCNAFAVVAAEELIRFRADPTVGIEKLSEEHFYSAIKQFDLGTIGLGLTPEDQDELRKNGTTFLKQAKLALASVGLCKQELMTYRPNEQPNHVSEIPQAAAQDALSRVVQTAEIEHNIIDPAVMPPQKTGWVDAHPNGAQLVSSVIIEKLRAGLPVVAAFAILDVDSWFGTNARHWGEIAYSLGLDRVADGPIGGHTVCITGYIPPRGTSDPSKGWFVFRNSWGNGFSRYIETDPMFPEAPAKGYGYVSVADTDVYCWEYLCRATPILPTDYPSV